MNILIDRLPDRVTVMGKRIPIRTDFRAGIEFETLIMGGETDAKRLLSVWFPGKVKHPAESLAAAADFFMCGGKISTSGGGGGGRRVYDFSKDGGAIAASFLGTYGIDLTSASMHWWLFRELLLNLPPDSAFKRIVSIRALNADDFSGDGAKQIRELQRVYGLDEKCGGTLAERDAEWTEYVSRRFDDVSEPPSGEVRKWNTTEE